MPNEALTASEKSEVVSRLTQSFGVSLESMITLAGAAVAKAAIGMTEPGGAIGILAGPGNTGAIALAAANLIHTWGVPVTVRLMVNRSGAKPTTAALADRLELANGHVYEPGAPLPRASVWVDGMYGTGFHEPIDEELAAVIDTVNHAGVPILAIDSPTGLDPNTGKATNPAIRADRTVSIGYPTHGLLKPYATQLVGELLVADVGIPPIIWRSYQVEPPIFRGKAVVRWHKRSAL